jgi:hypothetical protein
MLGRRAFRAEFQTAQIRSNFKLLISHLQQQAEIDRIVGHHSLEFQRAFQRKFLDLLDLPEQAARVRSCRYGLCTLFLQSPLLLQGGGETFVMRSNLLDLRLKLGVEDLGQSGEAFLQFRGVPGFEGSYVPCDAPLEGKPVNGDFICGICEHASVSNTHVFSLSLSSSTEALLLRRTTSLRHSRT